MNWENLRCILIIGIFLEIGVEFIRHLGEQGFNSILITRRKYKLKNLVKI